MNVAEAAHAHHVSHDSHSVSGVVRVGGAAAAAAWMLAQEAAGRAAAAAAMAARYQQAPVHAASLQDQAPSMGSNSMEAVCMPRSTCVHVSEASHHAGTCGTVPHAAAEQTESQTSNLLPDLPSLVTSDGSKYPNAAAVDQATPASHSASQASYFAVHAATTPACSIARAASGSVLASGVAMPSPSLAPQSREYSYCSRPATSTTMDDSPAPDKLRGLQPGLTGITCSSATVTPRAQHEGLVCALPSYDARVTICDPGMAQHTMQGQVAQPGAMAAIERHQQQVSHQLIQSGGVATVPAGVEDQGAGQKQGRAKKGRSFWQLLVACLVPPPPEPSPAAATRQSKADGDLASQAPNPKPISTVQQSACSNSQATSTPSHMTAAPLSPRAPSPAATAAPSGMKASLSFSRLANQDRTAHGLMGGPSSADGCRPCTADACSHPMTWGQGPSTAAGDMFESSLGYATRGVPHSMDSPIPCSPGMTLHRTTQDTTHTSNGSSHCGPVAGPGPMHGHGQLSHPSSPAWRGRAVGRKTCSSVHGSVGSLHGASLLGADPHGSPAVSRCQSLADLQPAAAGRPSRNATCMRASLSATQSMGVCTTISSNRRSVDALYGPVRAASCMQHATPPTSLGQHTSLSVSGRTTATSCLAGQDAASLGCFTQGMDGWEELQGQQAQMQGTPTGVMGAGSFAGAVARAWVSHESRAVGSDGAQYEGGVAGRDTALVGPQQHKVRHTESTPFAAASFHAIGGACRDGSSNAGPRCTLDRATEGSHNSSAAWERLHVARGSAMATQPRCGPASTRPPSGALLHSSSPLYQLSRMSSTQLAWGTSTSDTLHVGLSGSNITGAGTGLPVMFPEDCIIHEPAPNPDFFGGSHHRSSMLQHSSTTSFAGGSVHGGGLRIGMRLASLGSGTLAGSHHVLSQATSACAWSPSPAGQPAPSTGLTPGTGHTPRRLVGEACGSHGLGLVSNHLCSGPLVDGEADSVSSTLPCPSAWPLLPTAQHLQGTGTTSQQLQPLSDSSCAEVGHGGAVTLAGATSAAHTPPISRHTSSSAASLHMLLQNVHNWGSAAPAAQQLLAVSHNCGPGGKPRVHRVLYVHPSFPQVPNLYLKHFETLHVVNEGYAANIHQAYCGITQRMVVLKTYHLGRLDAQHRRHMHREISILARCGDHPHIVRLWAAFQEEEHVVLVLEHCDSGDMHHILQKHRNRVISERHVVVKVLVPLLTALQDLHAHGIVHRDLKPENLCFSKGQLRLCDFGLAVDTRRERATSRMGTRGYIAPELLCAPPSPPPRTPVSLRRSCSTLTPGMSSSGSRRHGVSRQPNLASAMHWARAVSSGLKARVGVAVAAGGALVSTTGAGVSTGVAAGNAAVGARSVMVGGVAASVAAISAAASASGGAAAQSHTCDAAGAARDPAAGAATPKAGATLAGTTDQQHGSKPRSAPDAAPLVVLPESPACNLAPTPQGPSPHTSTPLPVLKPGAMLATPDSVWSSATSSSLAAEGASSMCSTRLASHTQAAQGTASASSAATASGREGTGIIQPALDIWAVGVITYKALCGHAPFPPDIELSKQLKEGKALPPLAFPKHVSPGACDFIAQALRLTASERPTASQLLAHPWLVATAQAPPADAGQQQQSPLPKGEEHSQAQHEQYDHMESLQEEEHA